MILKTASHGFHHVFFSPESRTITVRNKLLHTSFGLMLPFNFAGVYMMYNVPFNLTHLLQVSGCVAIVCVWLASVELSCTWC